MNTLKLKSALLCLAVLGLCPPSLQAEDNVEIVSVQKIWDKAPHNAFTDLVFHNGEWFCVFREGEKHVSPDGALRVLVSKDGDNWESAALITSDIADLRDAKITVSPEGQLMLCGAGYMSAFDKQKKAGETPTTHSHESYVWFSNDGRSWSDPVLVGDKNNWLWRVTWHKGTCYGVGYHTGGKRGTVLYSSPNGKDFSPLVKPFNDQGYTNESSLVFTTDDTAYCLLRRDNRDSDSSGIWGTSHPPYTEWDFKSTGVKLGGPHMIQLPDGRFVAAVRLYDKPVRTSLCWIDPETGKLTEFQKLPSGGDTSYAGLVWKDGLLWVSYYSSHEKKTSIYLAKVKIPLNQ
ncbi:MAG: exo-alpha-sialidase [Planctomycetaceae bacterium]|nr:exo-alpha-sialidase [Planctomycetaceae bacterium]